MNIFKPTIHEISSMQFRTAEEVKNEPMVFSADYEFALKNGGPITNEFLKKIDPKKDWLIDTRVHMLMEGWYPCIGGWHLDNVPRNTNNGQPNYKNPPFVCDQVLAVVDVGTESLTEFLVTPVELPDPPQDEKIYRYWSKIINQQLKNKQIQSKIIPPNSIISFDSFTFHRGTPASKMGWRFFIRATTKTHQNALNEIRKQVNTYIPIEAGW